MRNNNEIKEEAQRGGFTPLRLSKFQVQCKGMTEFEDTKEREKGEVPNQEDQVFEGQRLHEARYTEHTAYVLRRKMRTATV